MSEINGGLYRNDFEMRLLGSSYRRLQSIYDVYRRLIFIYFEGGLDIYSKFTIYFFFLYSYLLIEFVRIVIYYVMVINQ